MTTDEVMMHNGNHERRAWYFLVDQFSYDAKLEYRNTLDWCSCRIGIPLVEEFD